MKKELFIACLLCMLLLFAPRVIATTANVFIIGDGSDSSGTITSNDANDDTAKDFNCVIESDGGESDDCREWYPGGSYEYDLKLTATPSKGWESTEIEWSIKLENGDNLAGIFVDPKCGNQRSCNIKLIIGWRDPNTGESPLYTITAKFTANPNKRPDVDAGEDQSFAFNEIAGYIETELQGVVSDDGLPSGSNIAITWSQVSGPAQVTFAKKDNPETTVQFTAAGEYKLRLTASDGKLSNSDDIIIKMNAPICGDIQVNKRGEECDGLAGVCPAKESCILPGKAKECTCTRNYCTSECEFIAEPQGSCIDGQQRYILITKGACTKPECQGERFVSCGRPIVELPFFGTVQFIATIFIVFLVYYNIKNTMCHHILKDVV